MTSPSSPDVNLDTIKDQLYDLGFEIRPVMEKVALDVSLYGWSARITRDGTIYYDASEKNLRTIRDLLAQQGVRPTVVGHAEEAPSDAT